MNSSTNGKLDLLGRIAEMKRIYTVIESSIKDSACIVVTSGVHGEGKSTLSAGLAIAASKARNKKVLVVDFNWYSPSMDSIFDVEKGDRDSFLVEGWPLEKLVRSTKVPNLDVLPAPESKTPQESETREWAGFFSEILKQAKEKYDMVVVDTSAAYPTNQRMVDPIEICKSSDGVVVVTLTNVTPRQELKRACTAIETVGANILGIVANHWQNPLF